MTSPGRFAASLAVMATDLRTQPDEHSTASRLQDHALHLIGSQHPAVELVRARGAVEPIGGSPESQWLHRLQHEIG
ncbi:MAG TPA: hypothetical protein VFI46_06545 [Jiangellaceae bacterium]|nr:hypothetical protein [Jiangellaceae bacterium]